MRYFLQKIKQKLLLSTIIFISVLALLGCSAIFDESPQLGSFNSLERDRISSSLNPLDIEGPLTSFNEVAQYLREHNELPSNYITKDEARALGWVASEGNLHMVAPQMSIGGDKFGNREGLLPKSSGRVWYEADIDYEKGPRNAKRIVFSNDGLIYMTTDHYATFTDITEEGSVLSE